MGGGPTDSVASVGEAKASPVSESGGAGVGLVRVAAGAGSGGRLGFHEVWSPCSGHEHRSGRVCHVHPSGCYQSGDAHYCSVTTTTTFQWVISNNHTPGSSCAGHTHRSGRVCHVHPSGCYQSGGAHYCSVTTTTTSQWVISNNHTPGSSCAGHTHRSGKVCHTHPSDCYQSGGAHYCSVTTTTTFQWEISNNRTPAPPCTGHTHRSGKVCHTHPSDCYQSGDAHYCKETKTTTSRWHPVKNHYPIGHSHIAPSAPRSLSATAGDGRVTLNWSTPTGGGADRYLCWYKPAGGRWTMAVTTASRSCTISGLTNGTLHYFEVRARNSAGTSPASNAVTATPGASTVVRAPRAPRSLSATAGDGRVTLNWSTPTGGGADRYLCWYKPAGGRWTMATTTASRSCTISGLTNGVSHSFEVRARNSAGTSPASNTVTATPKASIRVVVLPVPERSMYHVTEGALRGTLDVAQDALDGYVSSCTTRSNDPLTVNRLAAIMLSIPVWELAGGNKQIAYSPMILSRWDTWDEGDPDPAKDKFGHRRLYSHLVYHHYKRAHWNPGVGLWQLDIFEHRKYGSATKLNHAERANISQGGQIVADLLRDRYCQGISVLKRELRSTWVACKEKCYATYQDIYNQSDDSLNVVTTPGSSINGGGITKMSCRWGNRGKIMDCYLYDVHAGQGVMSLDDRIGKGAQSPLAAPFISFTDDVTNPEEPIIYAVFPRWTTGYDKAIIKAVAAGENARDSVLGPSGNSWYDNEVEGRVLQSNCWITPSIRFLPLCSWVEVTDQENPNPLFRRLPYAHMDDDISKERAEARGE